jgi:SAM-dependent methyltransferase
MTKMTKWEIFFRDKLMEIFQPGKNIIDIGGGLRAVKGRGNRYDKKRSWLLPLISGVDYKILDPVADYRPDIVGDIHNLPFEDSSVDSIICLAVLEHVEDPFRAAREMHRSIKPGGTCFVYLPFLFYYHACEGYYRDYWRFTKDGAKRLFKDFASIEMCPVRGALSTWLHLSPLGRFALIRLVGQWLDVALGKMASNQVSGYYIYLVK